MSGCADCEASLPHPRVDCPLCEWPSFAHVDGLTVHVRRHHGIPAGGRLLMLVLEVARAQLRGWPLDGPTFAMREAFQLSGVSA
jgi:hypothetical protein